MSRSYRDIALMLLVIARLFTLSNINGQEIKFVHNEVSDVNNQWLALKTNLLLDAITALNVEVEVKIFKNISLSGELIMPWWLIESRQHAIQVSAFNVEAKYWTQRSGQMQGFFFGLHTGAGLYDLEWNRKGYQGEFCLATGVLAGYSMPLREHLNLEFLLGVGYINTDYQSYHAKQDFGGEWHLIKQYEGIYRWVGPSRAKISLVWFPRFKKKGGRI